jgi:hypothetical protein
MDEIPECKHETLDFALLPLGDRLVTAVPMRRMPQELMLNMLLAEQGGEMYLAGTDLLMLALCREDAEAFTELDFGDALVTVQAYTRTQSPGYPSVPVDLDMEMKDLFDD